jgi:hypothetical protein
MHNNNEIRKRNKFVIAGVITAVILLGTTAISTLTTAESVFAYRSNQATSQVSDCGNGFSPQSVGCQNTDSQIQGDKNSVALAGVQTFPKTCLECFTTFLTSEQITALESSPQMAGNTIEDLCAFWETFPGEISESLVIMADILARPDPGDPSGPPIADDLTIEQLVDCIERVFGLA